MPTERSFRQRVLARELLFGTFLVLDSPLGAEMVARTGLDWVLVDLEHGASTEATLLPQLLAIQHAGAVALVRVEQGTRLRIGRVLDYGADGVMVPQVSSVDEARDVVSAMRYPPSGRRGVALMTRGHDYTARGHAGIATRHEELVGIVQVESKAALESVEAVAATDGIDVVFVGPADLSHALGAPGQLDHPDFGAALERVSAAARSTGKAAGIMLGRPEEVTRYAGLGFSFFSITSDGNLLDRAVRGGLEAARQGAA